MAAVMTAPDDVFTVYGARVSSTLQAYRDWQREDGRAMKTALDLNSAASALLTKIAGDEGVAAKFSAALDGDGDVPSAALAKEMAAADD